MTDIEKVYQAIKSLPQPTEQGKIINASGLSEDEVVTALRQLDASKRITHNSIPSTGKENNGEIITFGSISIK